ncbi:hypothetical protein PoB_000109400 [Plakobranchus ocellatus]|uniref:Uncharacterized protein n=1 Tax=Plakobranchus ocellatus TaxID=259542 RepID=A0AAV3XXV1_9GAST|nr:hypothetical protein PoB_000109400 [Plakobranchus ocellatus]
MKTRIGKGWRDENSEKEMERKIKPGKRKGGPSRDQQAVGNCQLVAREEPHHCHVDFNKNNHHTFLLVNVTAR